MTKVANKAIIRKLAFRSFCAQRNRNIVAVVAIALTALLFTSVMTIGGSLMTSIQDNTFRIVGTSLHAGYKYLTEDMADKVIADPEVSDVGYRIMAGTVMEEAFFKLNVEFSYMDEQYATTSFVVPSQGTLPQDTMDILVADTVLDALDLPQVSGQTIPLTVEIAGETQQIDFTVSGIYEADSVIPSTQIVVSRAFIDQYVPLWQGDSSGSHLAKLMDSHSYLAGAVMLNFNFPSAVDIQGQMDRLVQRMNFPAHTADPGVNWAYASDTIDPTFVLIVVAISLLITLSGYLIIYNIFLISVSQDVRFYGLLKTIGTTPRQLRRIVYQQALILFVIGTPLGLLLGYYVGAWLMPTLLTNTAIETIVVTQNPMVFVCSAGFSLVTVGISCRKPAKFAGKLSPIEALRHTEGGGTPQKAQQSGKLSPKISPRSMARANLRRNRKKTALVIVSLCLSGVIFNTTYTYVTGFDMEEFVSRFAVTDFLVSSETVLHYQYGSGVARDLEGVTPDIQETLEAMSGMEETGRVYVREQDHSLSPEARTNVEVALDEYGDTINPIYIQSEVAWLEEYGELRASIYGVSDTLFDFIETETSDYGTTYLTQEQQALFATGDYVLTTGFFGIEAGGTLYYPVGSTVTIDFDNGNTKEYEVLSAGTLSDALDKRYSRLLDVSFILPESEYLAQMGDVNPMHLTINVSEDTISSMDDFLADYTDQVDTTLGYESRSQYLAEFESMESMFWIVGLTLAGILALIGLANFINTTLSSILTRRRELAMLSAMGMTGKQIQSMLIWEGLYQGGLTIALILTLGNGASYLLVEGLSSMMMASQYQFSWLSALGMLAVVLVFSVLVPFLVGKASQKQSVVERLRME